MFHRTLRIGVLLALAGGLAGLPTPNRDARGAVAADVAVRSSSFRFGGDAVERKETAAPPFDLTASDGTGLRLVAIEANGVSEDSNWTSRWGPVLDRMLEELRSGSPRAEAYWAQQVAFGPVFFYAVALAVREKVFRSSDLELVRQILPHAVAMLGALPDGCDGDPVSLHLLARRQAAVLAWGRRRHLTRLAERLGLEASSLPSGPVPRRFQRPYELIGWRPPASFRGLDGDDPRAERPRRDGIRARTRG